MSVPLKEPRWWYTHSPSLAKKLLQPLGILVGGFAQRRWRKARPYCAQLPVVCIGNFTAGGTGKTPFALTTARLLAELGEAPVFLSRGYGGAERGPRRVDLTADRSSAVGDEALLLARAAPTFVSRDRAAGAKAIEAARAAGTLTASVIVMDDGLQNPSLAKDLTIALIDGDRGFGNGLVVPAGPLRAPLAFQLGLADIIVINGAQPPNISQPPSISLAPRFIGPVLHVSVVPATATAWLASTPIVAFAGIGNPARFFALVKNLGAEVVESIAFADHQPLTGADADRILKLAKKHNAIIVTTEKDSARLAGSSGPCGQLQHELRVLAIKLKFADGDEVQIKAMFQAALLNRRKPA